MSGSDRVPSWPAIAARGYAQPAVLHVQRWDASRDGVLTGSRLRRRLEDQGLWVSSRQYSPGEARQEPSADHDLVEVVLSGLLKLSVGGETAVLAAGDAAFVPKGMSRQVEVVGSAEVITYAGAFLSAGPSAGRGRPSRPLWH